MAIDPAISTAFSVSLAAFFAASAAHKARSYSEFAGVVRNYRIGPEALAPLVSPIIVAAEMLIAIGLLIPELRSEAAIGGAGLFLLYGAAIAVNLARGRTDIDCGCSFGGHADEGSERLTPILIVRNFVLASPALAASAAAATRELGMLDYAAILLFALTAAALYAAFESLRANWARFHAAGHV